MHLNNHWHNFSKERFTLGIIKGIEACLPEASKETKIIFFKQVLAKDMELEEIEYWCKWHKLK